MKDLSLLISQLKTADKTTVEFVDGRLVLSIEKECTCEPDEIGTGVMEEFTETHSFDIEMSDLKLTGITADN